MEIKVTNFKTKETKTQNVPQNTLVEVADKLFNVYGYGAIISKDFDKGILVLNNGCIIEDTKQKAKYKEMLKYM